MSTGSTRVRHNVERKRSPRERSKAVNPESTPEIRIGRRVPHVRNQQIPGWDEFLNEHGEYHYGDGSTRSLGSLALTYISANEMGKMLSVRFPNDYGNGRTGKTRGLISRIHKDFIDFIRVQDDVVTAFLQAADSRELAQRFDEESKEVGIQYIPTIDQPSTHTGRNQMWQASPFHVRGVEPYGRGQISLGLDLAHPINEALRFERRTIVQEFLRKDLKLAVHELDTTFDPHVTFFTGFQPIPQIQVRDVARPSEIMLSSPQAIVNFKK